MKFNKIINVANGKTLGYQIEIGKTRINFATKIAKEVGLKVSEIKNEVKMSTKDFNKPTPETEIYLNDTKQLVDELDRCYNSIHNNEQYEMFNLALGKKLPKIKVTKQLKFKNGLCLIEVGSEEAHGEYQTYSSRNEFIAIFKTKKAIKDVAKEIPTFNAKSALGQFEMGKKHFRITTPDGYSAYRLLSIADGQYGYAKEGSTLMDINEYSGRRLNVNILAPFYPLPVDEHTYLGTTADSQCLADVKRAIQNAISKGDAFYYGEISLKDFR